MSKVERGDDLLTNQVFVRLVSIRCRCRRRLDAIV
jgi:hypothetical protein